jgi:hypothetical protein
MQNFDRKGGRLLEIMPLIIFWSKFQEKMTNALASSFLHEYKASSLPFLLLFLFDLYMMLAKAYFTWRGRGVEPNTTKKPGTQLSFKSSLYATNNMIGRTRG